MKKMNKKGFTITELVIVIAVIAILAGVLIPTFISISNKANLSADQQAVRQMNVVLSAEFATKNPEDLKQVVDLLDKEGYNVGSLTPLTKDHTFYWCEGTKTIVLVKGTNTVVYPENASFDASKAHKLSDGASFINVKATTADVVKAALENGSDVTLEADIVLSIKVVLASGNDITIDLNGHDIDASSISGRPFEVSNGTTLTINADGSTIKCGEYGLIKFDGNGTNTTVVLNGGTYTGALNKGAFIKTVGTGTMNITLNNITYTDTSTNSYILNVGDADASSIDYLTINGGSFTSAFGFQGTNKTVIDGATITTDGFAIEAKGDSVIKNCTIKSGNTTLAERGLAGNVYPAAVAAEDKADCNVTVSNCTIDSAYAFATMGVNGKITATNITGSTNIYTPCNGTITVN